MKILILGSGAREHAIAEKISENKRVEKIFCCPGNVYYKFLKNAENIFLENIDDIVNFAKTNKIDLTIVGNEEFLVEGIVDKFEKENLKIFGPNKKAAMLEGSKAYAKNFMKKYGVSTAKYEIFDDEKKALEFITKINFPAVIKASGLAAGKGVVIVNNIGEAKKTIIDMMSNKIFKDAADTIVIEEFLDGVEASILSITDSKIIIPFISAKDHKKIFEGEKGLNTGGMGVISPNPYYSEEVKNKFIKNILEPTLKGIKEEKMNFSGIIFFGLMITKDDVYLLEYNMRMGDPETQAVLPLMESDFLELIESSIEKKLKKDEIIWKNKFSCCVVGVANGYPLSYKKGEIISGIEKFEKNENLKLYTAGVDFKNDNFITNGGRVINIVGVGNNIEEARDIAYSNIEKIKFNGIYFRKDI